MSWCAKERCLEDATPQGRPRAVVLGCAGEELSAGERRFFAAADPAGFILFRRNCRSPIRCAGWSRRCATASGERMRRC